MQGSLKNRTLAGMAWSGIDNIFQFGVTFIVSIILARILSPDDYGLLGIITIFTALCTTLINAGFSTALIRKNNATDSDYNTVFIINLIMSLVLYVIIYASAPFISDFFNREELTLLIKVSSIGIILGALAIVQHTRLTKRIDFKSQTKITIIASVASGAIGILMALLGYGVWALVTQQLSSQLFRTILLWYVNKWLPNIQFSYSSFRELFGFGWKILASELLETIWKELYQVVVGKFYSPATLGQYTRAKQFSTLFSSNLTTVIGRVTFPVLSNIQDDKERMVVAYRKLIKSVMFIAAIPMFFLGAISEPLLYCLIGEEWHDAAIYLPLICICGSLYPLHALNLNMLKVQGRSDLFLGIEIVKRIVTIIPLLVGVFVGILPMLFVNLLNSVFAFFLNSHYSGKVLGYNSLMQIKDIAPSFTIAIVLSLSVYFLKYIPLSYWLILPIQLIMGGIIFIIICHITNNDEYNEIRGIVSSCFKRVRRKD